MKKTKFLYMLLPVFLLGNSTFKTSKGNEVILPFATNTIIKANNTSTNSNKDDSNFKYEFISNQKFDVDPSDEYEHVVTSTKNNNNKNEIQGRNVDMGTYPDYKEDNDSFQNASPLFSVGDYQVDKINITRYYYATISQKKTSIYPWAKKYVDKDFYSFDVTSNGVLAIDLTNIPENCDYDLRLYKQEDTPNSKTNEINFDLPIAFSNKECSDEHIAVNSVPGTYYAVVFSFLDKTFDNDHPYKITMTQKANTSLNSFSYDIAKGKENGDVAALWLSQYKPLGITPVTLQDTDSSKLKINNYEDYPFIRHLADKNNSIDNYVNYAVLYIWDLKTKAIISAIAKQLVEKLMKDNRLENDAQYKTNIRNSTEGLVLSIESVSISTISLVCTIAEVSAFLGPLGLMFDLTSFALAVEGLILALNNNSKFIATKQDIIAFLVSMQQTFSVGNGSDANEVKMLRLRYHFDNNDKEHILNWSPAYSASDYNFYNSNTIFSNIEHSDISGSLSGIKNADDIKKLLGV